MPERCTYLAENASAHQASPRACEGFAALEGPEHAEVRFEALARENPQRIFRLGVMGGTFDPIHIGHLACAEQVRDAFALDGVIFMPAGDPWMKRGRTVTAAEDRFAMVCAAVADNPLFGASRLEIDRPGATYTVDTLRQLRERYPRNVELFFISGADAVFRILEWRDAEALGKLAHLVAVTRPGYELTDARVRYLRTHASILHIAQIEVTALAISSTDLRQKVAAGKSIRYLVPQAVADYIEQHGLYRSEERRV